MLNNFKFFKIVNICRILYCTTIDSLDNNLYYFTYNRSGLLLILQINKNIYYLYMCISLWSTLVNFSAYMSIIYHVYYKIRYTDCTGNITYINAGNLFYNKLQL